MAEYKTRQKEVLLEYLTQTRDTPQSIEEIALALKNRGEDLGKSTIYRLIKKLSDDGSVKYFSEGKRFLYQLFGGEECHHHLHLKCTSCGKLMHMDHEQSEKIIENIYGENGFSVNESDTTLFGKCGECIKKTN
ncbi:MAG: transcriptional repressor [Oscillospiraceae bacterium]|nr:transcriptional repressor [Oscillospiraceae bacterium]